MAKKKNDKGDTYWLNSSTGEVVHSEKEPTSTSLWVQKIDSNGIFYLYNTDTDEIKKNLPSVVSATLSPGADVVTQVLFPAANAALYIAIAIRARKAAQEYADDVATAMKSAYKAHDDIYHAIFVTSNSTDAKEAANNELKAVKNAMKAAENARKTVDDVIEQCKSFMYNAEVADEVAKAVAAADDAKKNYNLTLSLFDDDNATIFSRLFHTASAAPADASDDDDDGAGVVSASTTPAAPSAAPVSTEGGSKSRHRRRSHHRSNKKSRKVRKIRKSRRHVLRR